MQVCLSGSGFVPILLLGGVTFMKIPLTIASSAGCLVASLLVTWAVWEIQIDGRAFHCTDAGPFTLSVAFWTSANLHQSAGDQIQPGWTWDKVAVVNGYYELAFFALWVAGSMESFRFIHKRLRTQSHEHIAQPG